MENMAQASDRNTEEHAEKSKEDNKESQETTNGKTEHDGVKMDETKPEEDIPGGRPHEVSPEKTESSPSPPEEEHRAELNQENGELNKPEEKSTGNTEERPEAKNEEPKQESQGHRIEPEVIPHPNDGGHVVQETEAQSGADGEIPRLEPNAEKEMHGGVEDVHSRGSSQEKTDSEKEESGPDLDAVLHGGDRHAHAPVPANVNPETDAQGEFGVDPERVMHSEGGANVHAHRRGPAHRGLSHKDPAHRDKDPTTSGEDHHDYATDIDSVLHGGEKHIHSPDARTQDKSDDLPEVPIGATDLEALVHGGDGHVHSSSSSSSSRTDPEPRPYGVQDPESVLHGSDDHEHRIQQEAVDGSRPLPSQRDPDSSPMNVDPEDVRIGTLRPEDGADYHQWKAEKKQEEEEEGKSSWLPGFTYLKDGFWKDLRAVKDRYLARFWSGEGKTDDGKPVRAPHDEP